MDAALDTLNAERVAKYMVMVSSGQRPSRPGLMSSRPADVPQQAPQSEKQQPCSVDAAAVCPQFIVVSHKPQVFEQASCLVGVYSHELSSHSVTAHYPQK